MPGDWGLPDLSDTRRAYAGFMPSCRKGNASYGLTPAADVSSYAKCFALFNFVLIGDESKSNGVLARELRDEIRAIRGKRTEKPVDKPYRQLLTFTLSALSSVGALSEDPLADLVEEQIPLNVGQELRRMGCLEGLAGSGNQAMFLAVFLIHARDWVGSNTQSRIDEWVDLHLGHMNRFGLWGNQNAISHLQFQNGYHQHEIFEYLGIDCPHREEMLVAIRSLADQDGHFAPYPGGGGCYDYDAIFLLTPDGGISDEATRALLVKAFRSIVAEQNPDGGFCESHKVRPRSIENEIGFLKHILRMSSNFSALKERARYAMSLQRPFHDRIHTHWSNYSRRWDESDLWDSWFRMLSLARIDTALNPENAVNWGFINYPGIGYHPTCSKKTDY